jgi:hypothetical protein
VSFCADDRPDVHSSALSQTLSDYIYTFKGDTLVIKEYYDMDNQANSLNFAMVLVSFDVPAGELCKSIKLILIK